MAQSTAEAVDPSTYTPVEQHDIHWGPPLATDKARAQAYREQINQWLQNPYTLSEGWAKRAHEELGEDPTTVHKNVNELRSLVKEEKSLQSRLDDHFLLCFLRAKRHEVQGALQSLLKYYRMKQKNPDFFELCLPSDFPQVYTLKATNIMEGFDKMHRPICYFQADFPPSEITNRQFIQMVIHMLEFFILDPRLQVAGITIVCDLAGQSLGHARLITVKFLKLILQIFQGSFPMRLKTILLLHGSLLFRTTYKIIKPWIPEKFKDRIHIMSGDIKAIHDFISQDVLPECLEGNAHYRQEAFSERVSLIEDLYREWETYGYDKHYEVQSDDLHITVTEEELASKLHAEMSKGEMNSMEKAAKKSKKK